MAPAAAAGQVAAWHTPRRAKRPPKIIERRQRTSLPPDSGILQRWRDIVDNEHAAIETGSMNSIYHMAT
jgi:hypothetical protein